jgi:hypothetical protein
VSNPGHKAFKSLDLKGFCFEAGEIAQQEALRHWFFFSILIPIGFLFRLKNHHKMKLLYAFGFSILFFISCKKSVSSTPSSIQYKVNGALVQIVGGRDTSGRDIITGANYGCFVMKLGGSSFYSVCGADKSHELLIGISTSNDSLLETTYSGISLDLSFTINDTAYGIINNGDQMTLNISRYSNGTIDATFSGTVSDSHADKKTITEGRLNDLKVYY